jgi:accessory gene regulator protein AgrB
MRKIVNITVFALAGLTVLLTVIFGVGFNQETKDKFRNTAEIKVNNPQMLSDLENATIETLPNFVKKYQEELTARNEALKKQQAQRNIFYTYTYHLGNIANQETFDNFKAKFPNNLSTVFSSAENKEYFIDGFSKVKSFAEFKNYYEKICVEYEVVRQDHLVKVSAAKAETTLLKQVSDINDAISVSKKQYDLETLQKNIKSFKAEATEFNFALILSYLLFFVTCALVVTFLLMGIFSNLKSNFGMLIGIGILLLLVVIGYATASSELSPVAIKEKADPGTVRWVGAGLFVGYCMFFGTIAVIVVTMIINSLKKAK